MVVEGSFELGEAELGDKNDITLRGQENDEPIENNSAVEATRGTYHSILNNAVLRTDFLQTATGTRSEPRMTREPHG